MTSGEGMSGNVGGASMRIANFVFDVPLSDVVKLIIGTRLIARWNGEKTWRCSRN